jgi:uncharacterized protein (DUF2237 family)
MTGFFRDGCCNTSDEDFGSHTICVLLTADFLEFSKARGNDLSTPRPEFGFPGLHPGDRWCLCAARWREALHAGKAPRVVLNATNEACTADRRPRRPQAARDRPELTLRICELGIVTSSFFRVRRWVTCSLTCVTSPVTSPMRTRSPTLNARR